MPAKTTWLKIPVLFFHNFVKQSKKASSLLSDEFSHFFHELIFVRKKKVRCTGNLYDIFGLWTRTVDCGLWTIDGTTLRAHWLYHKGAYKKAQRRRQREHQLKLLCSLLKVIMRAKCGLIVPEWNCYPWIGDNNMSSHVLHTISKQVISSLWLEKNGRKTMLVQKVQNCFFWSLNMQICDVLVSPVVLFAQTS